LTLTATPPTTKPSTTTKAKRSIPDIPPLLIVILLVIAVVATGVGYLESTSGGTAYGCMNISHQGNGVKVTTDGLIHYVNSGFYISCPEGANLPSSSYKTSCLTVSPKTITAPIGVGASTDYYYLSASGSTISVAGSPNLSNGTEIITPSGVSLTVTC
jgi:hypothetical protein